MIYTSYFGKIKKLPPEQKARCISIARFTPKGVNIPQHIYLAPSKDILFRYKQVGDKEAHTKSYLNYLGTLDASRIVKNLEGQLPPLQRSKRGLGNKPLCGHS